MDIQQQFMLAMAITQASMANISLAAFGTTSYLRKQFQKQHLSQMM
jgi:hypothetical protein